MPLPALAWPAVWAFLAAIIKPVVKQVIIALGLGLVVFTGLEIGFNEMFDYLDDQLSGMEPMVAYVLKASGFMSAISMWAGAITSVIAFKQLTGGAKMVWKVPK